MKNNPNKVTETDRSGVTNETNKPNLKNASKAK